MLLLAFGCSSGTGRTTPRATVSPTGSAAPVHVHLCDRYEYRPHEITVACGDGNARVRSLRWSEWTSVRAVGLGTWQQNGCEPDCARGTFHDYPVQLTLDQPSGTGSARFFSRVVADFAGAKPPYDAYRSGHVVLMANGHYVP